MKSDCSSLRITFWLLRRTISGVGFGEALKLLMNDRSMGVPSISGIGPFCVLQAGSVHGVNPYPVSVIGILPLPESGGKDTKMTDVMNCVDKLLEKKA